MPIERQRQSASSGGLVREATLQRGVWRLQGRAHPFGLQGGQADQNALPAAGPLQGREEQEIQVHHQQLGDNARRSRLDL